MKNLLIILISFVFMTGCIKPPSEDLVKTGMSKSEIIAVIGGKPSAERFMTKRNSQIQGPEKKFWDEIDMGTKLEQWTYHLEQGTLKLYFLGNNDILDHKAFYPNAKYKKK